MTPEETASALPDGDEAATSAPSLLAFPDWLEQNQAAIKEPLQKYRGYSDYVKQETLAQGRYSDTLVDKLDTRLAGLAVESGDYAIPEGQTEYRPSDVLARPKSNELPVDSLLRFSSDQNAPEGLREASAAVIARRKLVEEGHIAPEMLVAAEADLRQIATPEIMSRASALDVKQGNALAAIVPSAAQDGAPTVEINDSLFEFVNDDGTVDEPALGKALKMHGTDPSLIPAIRAKLARPEGYAKTAAEIEKHGEFISKLDTLAATRDADGNYKVHEELKKIGIAMERGNEQYVNEYGMFNLRRSLRGTPLEDATEDELKVYAKDYIDMNAMPEIDAADPVKSLKRLSTGAVVAPLNLMLNEEAFKKAIEDPSVPAAQRGTLKKQQEYAVEANAASIINTLTEATQGGTEFVNYLDAQRTAGKKDAQIVKDWVGMGKFSSTKSLMEGVRSSLGEAVMPFVYIATGADPDGFAMKAMVGAQIEDSNRRAYAQLFGYKHGIGYDLSKLAAPVAVDLGASFLTRGASVAVTTTGKVAAGAAIKSLMRTALTAETRSMAKTWITAAARSGIKEAGLQVTGRETVDQVISMAGRDITSKIVTGTSKATFYASAFNRSATSTYASLSTALSNQQNPDGSPKYSKEEVKEISMTHALAAGSITVGTMGAMAGIGIPGIEKVFGGNLSRGQLNKVWERLRKDVSKLPPGTDMSSAQTMLSSMVKEGVRPIFSTKTLAGKAGNALAALPEPVKGALSEAPEEALDEFMGYFNEAIATGDKIDIRKAATSALYAGSLGIAMGGTVTSITSTVQNRKAPPARVEADIRRERLLEMAGKLESSAPQTAQVFRNYAFQQRSLIPQRQQLEGDLKAAKTPEAKAAIRKKIDTLNEQSRPTPTQENIPEADAAEGAVPPPSDAGMAPEGKTVVEGTPEGRAAAIGRILSKASETDANDVLRENETSLARWLDDKPEIQGRQAHGTDFRRATEVLDNGIDPTRIFHTAGVSAKEMGSGLSVKAAGLNQVVMVGKGDEIRSIADVDFIVVNDNLAPAIEEIRAAYPQVKWVTTSEAPPTPEGSAAVAPYSEEGVTQRTPEELAAKEQEYKELLRQSVTDPEARANAEIAQQGLERIRAEMTRRAAGGVVPPIPQGANERGKAARWGQPGGTPIPTIPTPTDPLPEGSVADTGATISVQPRPLDPEGGGVTFSGTPEQQKWDRDYAASFNKDGTLREDRQALFDRLADESLPSEAYKPLMPDGKEQGGKALPKDSPHILKEGDIAIRRGIFKGRPDIREIVERDDGGSHLRVTNSKGVSSSVHRSHFKEVIRADAKSSTSKTAPVARENVETEFAELVEASQPSPEQSGLGAGAATTGKPAIESPTAPTADQSPSPTWITPQGKGGAIPLTTRLLRPSEAVRRNLLRKVMAGEEFTAEEQQASDEERAWVDETRNLPADSEELSDNETFKTWKSSRNNINQTGFVTTDENSINGTIELYQALLNRGDTEQASALLTNARITEDRETDVEKIIENHKKVGEPVTRAEAEEIASNNEATNKRVADAVATMEAATAAPTSPTNETPAKTPQVQVPPRKRSLSSMRDATVDKLSAVETRITRESDPENLRVLEAGKARLVKLRDQITEVLETEAQEARAKVFKPNGEMYPSADPDDVITISEAENISVVEVVKPKEPSNVEYQATLLQDMKKQLADARKELKELTNQFGSRGEKSTSSRQLGALAPIPQRIHGLRQKVAELTQLTGGDKPRAAKPTMSPISGTNPKTQREGLFYNAEFGGSKAQVGKGDQGWYVVTPDLNIVIEGAKTAKAAIEAWARPAESPAQGVTETFSPPDTSSVTQRGGQSETSASPPASTPAPATETPEALYGRIKETKALKIEQELAEITSERMNPKSKWYQAAKSETTQRQRKLESLRSDNYADWGIAVDAFDAEIAAKNPISPVWGELFQQLRLPATELSQRLETAGYVKQGELYIFQPAPAATSTPTLSDLFVELPEGYPLDHEDAKLVSTALVMQGGLLSALNSNKYVVQAARKYAAWKGIAIEGMNATGLVQLMQDELEADSVLAELRGEVLTRPSGDVSSEQISLGETPALPESDAEMRNSEGVKPRPSAPLAAITEQDKAGKPEMMSQYEWLNQGRIQVEISRSRAEVSSPTPTKTVSVDTVTLDGTKKIRGKVYALPGYNGPELMLYVKKVRGVSQNFVYTYPGGVLLSDRRGDSPSDVAEVFKSAVQRLSTWANKTGQSVFAVDHADRILRGVQQKKPVSALATEAYQIKLPEGYVKQGDLYVYQTDTPRNTPPAKPAAEVKLVTPSAIESVKGEMLASAEGVSGDRKVSAIETSESEGVTSGRNKTRNEKVSAFDRAVEDFKTRVQQLTGSEHIYGAQRFEKSVPKGATVVSLPGDVRIKLNGVSYPAVIISETKLSKEDASRFTYIYGPADLQDNIFIRKYGDGAGEVVSDLLADKKRNERTYRSALGSIAEKNEMTVEQVEAHLNAFKPTDTPRNLPSSTPSSAVTKELDKFGFSEGLTTFLTNVSKKGGKQYAPLAKLLLDAGAANVDIRTVNLPNTEAAGFYVGANGVVHINTAKNGPRGAVDTVLHELVHAVTEGSLRNPTPAQAKVIARIERVRATVTKRAKANGTYDNDLRYALGDNAEFLTHFFTSQRFRDQVSAMTPKSEKNWLMVIADLIADLIAGRTKAQRLEAELRKELTTLITAPRIGLAPSDVILKLPTYENAQMGATRIGNNSGRGISTDTGENEDLSFAEFNRDGQTGTLRPTSTDEGVSPVYATQTRRGTATDLRFQPASDARNVARFHQLTESLYRGRDEATAAEIEAWKNENPEKWEELSAMREDVLRAGGWDTGPLFHSGAEWDVFDFNKSRESIGLHVGTQTQAGDMGDIREGKALKKLMVKAVNPIRLTDKGVWDFDTVAPQLEALGVAIPEEHKAQRETYREPWGGNKPGYVEWSNATLADDIEHAGFDSVIYLNESEGVDHAAMNKDSRLPPPAMRQRGDWTPEILRDYGAEDSYIIFDPTQIKSAEPISPGPRLTPDRWADAASPDIRFQPAARNTDAEYLAAVEAGDMETAQRMVDEAARAAGYDLGPIYHGSTKARGNFTVFRNGVTKSDAFRLAFDGLGPGWFTSNQEQAGTFSGKEGRILSAHIKLEKPWMIFADEFAVAEHAERYRELQALKKKDRENSGNDPVNGWFRDGLTFEERNRMKELYALGANEEITKGDSWEGLEKLRDEAKLQYPELSDGEAVRRGLSDQGYDGVILEATTADGGFGADTRVGNLWVIPFRGEEQIKSADPVTYDDDGNVIPLPQRFQSTSPDIRFQGLTEQDFTPASLRDTATGFLPDDVTLDDLTIDFADLADITEGLDPVNAENAVHAAVNHALARRAGEAAIPAPVRSEFDGDEAFDAATQEHAAEVARLTDTYELITRGRLTSEAMFRYRTNPGALARLVDYLTAAIKAAFNRFTARYDTATAVALNRMSRDLAKARTGFNHDIEPMAAFDPDAVMFQPSEFTTPELDNELEKYITGNWPADAAGQEAELNDFARKWAARYGDLADTVLLGAESVTAGYSDSEGFYVRIAKDEIRGLSRTSKDEQSSKRTLAVAINEEFFHVAQYRALAESIAPQKVSGEALNVEVKRIYAEMENAARENPEAAQAMFASASAYNKLNFGADATLAAEPGDALLLSDNSEMQLVNEMTRQIMQMRRVGAATETLLNEGVEYLENLMGVVRAFDSSGVLEDAFNANVAAAEDQLNQRGIRFQPAARPSSPALTPQERTRLEKELLNQGGKVDFLSVLYKDDEWTAASVNKPESDNKYIRRIKEMFVNTDGKLSVSHAKSKKNRKAAISVIEEMMGKMRNNFLEAARREDVDMTLVQIAMGNVDPPLTPDMEKKITDDFIAEVKASEAKIKATYEQEKITNPLDAKDNYAKAITLANAEADRNRKKAIWTAQAAEAEKRKVQQLEALIQLERTAPDTAEVVKGIRGSLNQFQRLAKEVNKSNPEILAIIDQTFGIYLVRSFGIHQDPKQIDLMLHSEDPFYKERKAALVNFFIPMAKEEIIRQYRQDPDFMKTLPVGLDEDAVIDTVTTRFQSQINDRALLKFEDFMLARVPSSGPFAEGSTVANEIQRYMKKSNMPQEFLDALMVNEDPIFNAMNTMMSLGRLVFHSRMLNEIHDSGIEAGQFITEAEMASGITYADGKNEMRRVFGVDGTNENIKAHVVKALTNELMGIAKSHYANGVLDTMPDRDTVKQQAEKAMKDFASAPTVSLADLLPQLGRSADRFATDAFISYDQKPVEVINNLQPRPGRFSGWLPVFSSNQGNSAFAPLGGLFAEPEYVKAMQATFKVNSKGVGHFSDDFMGQAHRYIVGAAGLSLGIITQGNPSFYTRNILGNTVTGAMNAVTPFHPKKVMLAMRTIRGMLNAKGEITNEMIELIAGRIILDAPQVGLIKQLIEDVMENPAAAMEDLTSESARADIKAGRLAKGSKKAAKAFVKQIGKFAEASEAFSKITVYADFKDILTEANFGSELEIIREASRLTNNVMPARSETPTLVDSFTRSGFGALLSPFLRFRVDIIRCTVNSFKLANEWRQSDNPVLRKHGQIKTAAWFGTVGILTVGLPIIMRSILGFDDEDDRYVRAANPAYNKDASLIYFRQKDENGNTVGLNTINLTYTNPLASFGDPLSRIVNATISNEPSEIPGIMGRYFVGDVLGENIVAGAVIDTWRNKDSNTGLPIYLAGESDLDKALKQAIHIGKAYTPKIGTQAYKFTQALNREEEDLPWNKPEGVLYATFAPFTNRASTFDDMDKSIFRRIHRDTAELSSLTFKATSRAPLNHGDIAGMFEKRQQLRIQQGKLLRDFMERSANIRGGDENMDTVVRNAIAAGNSRKSVSLLINQNVVERIQPPKEQLQKMGDISPVRTDEFYDWRDGYSSKIPLD
jgi:ADP-Ribosyltransferase in polyvalent proteins